MIREWLLPAWLMAVQSFVTMALILSLMSQVLLACVIVRWPLRTVLRYEWIFVTSAFIMVAISSKYQKYIIKIHKEYLFLVGKSILASCFSGKSIHLIRV